MHTTEYCNYSGPLVPDSPFCSLTFYETARFRKDLRTGCFLSAGPEERSFVASLADDLDETVAIAECRLLQPCALPGEIEAYGKPVIQIDCVYEEPESVADGAAEALISALPGVVQDLYGETCHVIIFPPVPEAHTDMAGTPDYEIEKFVCRLGRIGKYRIVPGELLMIEGVNEKISALGERLADHDAAHRPEEAFKGVCGREMI